MSPDSNSVPITLLLIIYQLWEFTISDKIIQMMFHDILYCNRLIITCIKKPVLSNQTN